MKAEERMVEMLHEILRKQDQMIEQMDRMLEKMQAAQTRMQRNQNRRLDRLEHPGDFI